MPARGCARAAAPRRRHRHRQRLPGRHARPPNGRTCAGGRHRHFAAPRSTWRAPMRGATASPIASRSSRRRTDRQRQRAVRFHPVESAVRDRSANTRTCAGSARIRAGHGAGSRRGRLARHPADRRSRARRISRPAARCSSRSATSRPMRSPSWSARFRVAEADAHQPTTCSAFPRVAVIERQGLPDLMSIAACSARSSRARSPPRRSTKTIG